jgi:H+-translocating NAD(P) transhydrogenase subunit alpha
MKILVLKEKNFPHEKRIAITPDNVRRFKDLGLEVFFQQGLGQHLNLSDEEFLLAGAQKVTDPLAALPSTDLLLSVQKPSSETLSFLKKEALVISFLDPLSGKELIQDLLDKNLSSISLELMPRTTLAQKMDALSSQANLAGYVAVITAASLLPKIFPMMTTPAGTLSPSTVFIIGAGVAGLQAIATARRLGANVFAFDTRPIVEEQVKSLGAKFIKIDLGETGATKEGYAKALTDEQLAKQREAMEKACLSSDIVITTAQTFGKKAPLLLTHKNLQSMKPGSILIDLAIDSGGNIEGSKPNEIVEYGNVRILGLSNPACKVALHASQMYSSNLYYLVNHCWNKQEKKLQINPEDEILKGCLLTHQKRIINESIRKLYS